MTTNKFGSLDLVGGTLTIWNTTKTASLTLTPPASGTASLNLASGIQNDSTVTGVTVKDALNTLQGSVGTAVTSLTGAITGTGPGATATTLSNSVVSNIHVSPTAAIAYSKLNLTGAVTNSDLAGSIAVSKLAPLTVSRALVTDGTGVLAPSATTATEVSYLSGVTSSIQGQLATKVDSTQKGAALGVASLDAGGKVPAAQLPSSLMDYRGTWNASTNSPTLADGTGDAGDVYVVSVAGTANLGSGPITFAAGDWALYSGTVWQKSINSNAVASVNGYTGAVVLAKADVGLSNVDNTSDLSKPISTATQTALNAIDQTQPRQQSFAKYASIAHPAGTLKLQCVTVVNGYAYVGTGAATPTMLIYDVRDQARPTLVGQWSNASPVSGGTYKIVVSGNYAYISGAGTTYLFIVDVSNPASPTTAGYVNLAGGSVYQVAVSGSYVFCATQSSGLQVVNATTPSAPVVVYNEAGGQKAFGIDIQGTNLFVSYFSAGTAPYAQHQVKVWNVTTPSTPTLTTNYTLLGNTCKPGHLVVSGSSLYCTDLNLGQVHIIDISTPSAPNYLSSMTLTAGGVNTGMQAVPGTSSNYVYLMSGGNATYGGSVDYFDVTNRSAPLKVGTYQQGVASSVWGGGWLDGGYLYIANYGVAPGSAGTFEVLTNAAESLTAGTVQASSLSLASPLALGSGGTGATTAPAALNALLPSQTGNSGKVLTTDGAGTTSWLTLTSSPTLAFKTNWTNADGATKVVTHSLGTTDVAVFVRDSTGERILVDTDTATSTSQVTLTASVAPTGTWRVLVLALV